MSACDIDDMVLELARIARITMERQIEQNKREQTGEAFEGLEQE